MRPFICYLVFVLLAAITPAAQSDRDNLQCVTPGAALNRDDGVEPGSAREKERLSQAPHGGKRTGKHTVVITWSGGQRTFKDKPPFNEPLDGVSWAYCGYSASLHFHLIAKTDTGLFTGVLVDDERGTVLPGGEAVLFSPDRQYYIAYEQPDGQDGETLKLYKRDGTLVWKGYNGILSSDGKSVVVDSEHMKNMRWDKENRPQATAVLNNGKTQTITLTRTSKGTRQWLPKIQHSK